MNATFIVLLCLFAAVHLHLEYRIWIRRETDIFRKYRTDGTEPLRTAKWAYYAKSVWLIGLIFLQAAGVPFEDAVVYTFAAYAAILAFLLRRNAYNLIQLAAALGFLGITLARALLNS